MSRKRLLWSALLFVVFLFGAEMCSTMSRTGANFSVWAAIAVVTIASAAGTGWLAAMPSLEVPSPQPTPQPTSVGSRQDVDDWSRYEDAWVEA